MINTVSDSTSVHSIIPTTPAAHAPVHVSSVQCSEHLHTPSESSSEYHAVLDLRFPIRSELIPLTRSCIEATHIHKRWLDMIVHMHHSSLYRPSELDEIRSHIEHGVSLHFDECGPPPPKQLLNSPSVYQHIATVRARLAEYIEWGAIVELPHTATAPDNIQPLLVIIKPGKKARLCVDLSRNMNDALHYVPFRYSTVTDAVRLSFPRCWYAKLDLSNCFLSFPLHPMARPYLRFQLDDRYYQFDRMPFGLASAPRICTQLLSVVAHELTLRGVTFVRYLDDFLFIAADHHTCAHMLSTALRVFTAYGLVVNPDKTEHPTQCITFLGIVLDSIQCILSVSQERCEELLQLMSEYKHTVTCSGHSLLSLIGKLSFAAQVMPGARPFMRRLLDAVSGHRGHKLVRLPPSFQIDLRFWESRMLHWNRRSKWVTGAPWILVSDASLEGFGFHCWSIPSHINIDSVPRHLIPGAGHYGYWSKCHTEYTDSHRKIGWCEMFSALFALLTYASLMHDQSVILVLDNKSDVDIINRQATRSTRIALLLRAMFDICYQHNISISARHLPGVDNVLADFLSRQSLHQNIPLITWHSHISNTANKTASVPSSECSFNPALPMSLHSVMCLHSRQLVLHELIDSQHMHSNSLPLCRLWPG